MLLFSAGLATAIPLLCFGGAATRIPLSTLGLLQYIGPTIQLMLAIFVPIMGIGQDSAVVALFLYSLLPIVRILRYWRRWRQSRLPAFPVKRPDG